MLTMLGTCPADYGWYILVLKDLTIEVKCRYNKVPITKETIIWKVEFIIL